MGLTKALLLSTISPFTENGDVLCDDKKGK